MCLGIRRKISFRSSRRKSRPCARTCMLSDEVPRTLPDKPHPFPRYRILRGRPILEDLKVVLFVKDTIVLDNIFRFSLCKGLKCLCINIFSGAALNRAGNVRQADLDFAGGTKSLSSDANGCYGSK